MRILFRLFILNICILSTQTRASVLQKLASKASPVYVQPPRDKPRSGFGLAINPATLLFPWFEIQVGYVLTPNFRINVTPQLLTWAWNGDPFTASLFGGTISGSVDTNTNGSSNFLQT